MSEEKPSVVAKATLTFAQVLLTALSVVKELLISAMAFMVQHERIKGKKIEDELELMKADKRVDAAKKEIQDKADSVDARSGIDEFLSKRGGSRR